MPPVKKRLASRYIPFGADHLPLSKLSRVRNQIGAIVAGDRI